MQLSGKIPFPWWPCSSVCLLVRHFPDKGLGVTSNDPITAGQFVVEYRGKLIWDQALESKKKTSGPLAKFLVEFKFNGKNYGYVAVVATSIEWLGPPVSVCYLGRRAASVMN